jgi:hypothetical protein
VGGTGLEDTTKTPGITEIEVQRGTESGTVSGNSALGDADLGLIVSAWSTLAAAIRQGIVETVKVAVEQARGQA